MSNEQAKWYVLHTYSGYENMVKKSIEQLRENNNLHDTISDVVILTEDTIEEKNGKRKVVETKTMPCYVFVKIVYSSQMWYMLTNTRGVTGFVGPQGKATELSDEEVKRLRLETVVTSFSMQVGDSVKVVSGPFDTMVGTIKAIDEGHARVTVLLNMFGGETVVDMDYIQIEAMK